MNISGKAATRCFRQAEIKWQESHWKELLLYAGQWVALEGETVVAHGEDLSKVVETAKGKSITIPYVFFVEDTETDAIAMGL